MFFQNEVPNIISVMKLSWEESNSYAASRNFHALSFRITGNANYLSNDTQLKVGTGDLLFVPKGVGYHIHGRQEELYVIHFTCDEITQKHLEVFHTYDAVKIKNIFSRCYEIWSKKMPGYNYATLAQFCLILEQVCKISSMQFTDESYQKIKPALDYIHLHFHDSELSIPMLCKLANMSDTYFRKLFFQHAKTTPQKYITQLRIAHAKELIKSDYYKMIQISKACGFDDEKYFYKVFKQHTGFTPIEYKNL